MVLYESNRFLILCGFSKIIPMDYYLVITSDSSVHALVNLQMWLNINHHIQVTEDLAMVTPILLGKSNNYLGITEMHSLQRELWVKSSVFLPHVVFLHFYLFYCINTWYLCTMYKTLISYFLSSVTTFP